MHLMQLKDDLYKNHWREQYNWHGVSISKLATHYNCSEDHVRQAMIELQQENPKPKATPQKDKCKSCNAPIVWMEKHPFDPPVIKGMDAAGKWHTVRQSHFASCPHADQHRKAS